jgi:hypothetical protein
MGTLLSTTSVSLSATSACAQYTQFAPAFDPNNTLAGALSRGDDEDVGVSDKTHPDYQAAGIHAGGFIIYPRLTASFTYDDNIYAVQNGAVGDGIFSVQPEIDLESTWSRNAIAAYIRALENIYTKYATEDTSQYGLGLSGKYEFGDHESGEALLTGSVNYGLDTLPRSAANVGNNGSFEAPSKNPIQYDDIPLDIQLSDTFNRLRLTGRFDFEDYDYHNGETAGGAEVFEKIFSHWTGTYTAKAEYAISPEAAVFLSAAYNNRQYELSLPSVPYDSNSKGYNIAAGANFDITHLVRGEVQLGYVEQDYASKLFPVISGLSTRAQIEWFPTQMTTVTGTALRTVADSTVIGAPGYLVTTGGLRVDHELLRNLIVTVNGSVTENRYQGTDRVDEIYGVGAAANWLLTRRVGLTIAYTHLDQQSSGTARGPSFGDNRVTLSTVLKY